MSQLFLLDIIHMDEQPLNKHHPLNAGKVIIRLGQSHNLLKIKPNVNHIFVVYNKQT